MRESKFRGKRLDNGEWEYGFYVNYGWSGKEKPHIIPSYASALYGFEVDPLTVGESTGLLDKNGKEIYEDDILHNEEEDSISTINWYDLNSQFVACTLPYEEDRHLELYLIDGCVVIGNVHENPELIEEVG